MKTNEELLVDFDTRARAAARKVFSGGTVTDDEIVTLETYLRSMYMERHYHDEVGF